MSYTTKLKETVMIFELLKQGEDPAVVAVLAAIIAFVCGLNLGRIIFGGD